jgi:hypothetical protein
MLSKENGNIVRNPKANAFIERLHLTIGKIIHTFSEDNLDENDPWRGTVLAATIFTVLATYHTTM